MQMILPLAVIGPSDIKKISRETAALEDYFTGASKRQTATPMQLPKVSHRLNELAKANGLNLLDSRDRQKLLQIVEQVEAAAPTINISFSSEPTLAFSQKIVEWFRREVHPLALITIGFQPTIVAGCTVRTTNRYFDFGLKHYFEQNRQKLIEALHGQNE